MTEKSTETEWNKVCAVFLEYEFNKLIFNEKSLLIHFRINILYTCFEHLSIAPVGISWRSLPPDALH